MVAASLSEADMGITPAGFEWSDPGPNRVRKNLRRGDGADRADACVS